MSEKMKRVSVRGVRIRLDVWGAMLRECGGQKPGRFLREHLEASFQVEDGDLERAEKFESSRRNRLHRDARELDAIMRLFEMKDAA
jgi:hypothetical protein